VIFRTPALAQRASQERLKLRGSIGVPHLVGEDQLAALPRRPRELPRVGFLDLPEPQRGGADVRQRQRGIGGGCLGLPVQQLPAYPLQLTPDRQFSLVEVDVVPRQAEHLAFAQAEHEDQHVDGVERILLRTRGLQELPGFFATPCLPLRFRTEGSLIELAMFLAIRSSVTAWDNAARRQARMSLTVREESRSSQHLPTAQHRRFFSARAASLPCAQH
jgi:hypothetical protein